MFVPTLEPALCSIFGAEPATGGLAVTTADLRDVSQSLLTMIKRTMTLREFTDGSRSLWTPRGDLAATLAQFRSTSKASSSVPLKRTLDSILQLIGEETIPNVKGKRKRQKAADAMVLDEEDAVVGSDDIANVSPEKKKKKRRKAEA